MGNWDKNLSNNSLSESFEDESRQLLALRPRSPNIELSLDVKDGSECILIDKSMHHVNTQPLKEKESLNEIEEGGVISEYLEDYLQLSIVSRLETPSIGLSLGIKVGPGCIFMDKFKYQAQTQLNVSEAEAMVVRNE